MIIPLGTDAPIYYWPFATVGMIVLNVAIFFGLQDEAMRPYVLEFGHGLHPVQWVTHNFLHGGFMHLFGNMIFLWAFGIIVEGKLGWWRFLGVYLLIGTFHGALVQTICLGMPPIDLGDGLIYRFAVGASAVIFGLLAMCMVWAPKNDLNCFVFFTALWRWYVGFWDIPIMVFAAFDIGMEIFSMALQHMVGASLVSSALGHLSGAMWGFLVAVAMLKFKWVDCEGWDLFSVWAGRHMEKGKVKYKGPKLSRRQREAILGVDGINAPSKEGTSTSKTPAERSAAAMAKVQKLVATGDHDGADGWYRDASKNIAGWQPPEPELMWYIKSLLVRKAWAHAVPPMRDYCRLGYGQTDRMRLKLSQVLIRDLERPGFALRVLAEVRADSLPPDLDKLRRQLVKQANQMQEEGVLELEGEE